MASITYKWLPQSCSLRRKIDSIIYTPSKPRFQPPIVIFNVQLMGVELYIKSMDVFFLLVCRYESKMHVVQNMLI